MGLKAVIGAAESFPSSDSEDLIAEYTGAPVAMEYGSVETNLIAHTHPDGGYRVFWKTYFVEVVPDEDNGSFRILVTSLYPRCFPLIRYDLGDRIVIADRSQSEGIDRFERVIGRCNDYLKIADGSLIHSEAITHAVRSQGKIYNYQAVQTGMAIELHYVASEPLLDVEVHEICSKLSRIHPALSQVIVRRVTSLQQTVAGKTPMIVRSSIV